MSNVASASLFNMEFEVYASFWMGSSAYAVADPGSISGGGGGEFPKNSFKNREISKKFLKNIRNLSSGGGDRPFAPPLLAISATAYTNLKACKAFPKIRIWEGANQISIFNLIIFMVNDNGKLSTESSSDQVLKVNSRIRCIKEIAWCCIRGLNSCASKLYPCIPYKRKYNFWEVKYVLEYLL